MAYTREVGDDGAVAFRSPDCEIVVQRLRVGVLLVSIQGQDKGSFESAVLDEIQLEIRRHGTIELFVDARRAVLAAQPVVERWTQWFQVNQRGLSGVSILVASKFIQLTMEVAKLFSRTGGLIRIYTDAGAFTEAVRGRVGQGFVLPGG